MKRQLRYLLLYKERLGDKAQAGAESVTSHFGVMSKKQRSSVLRYMSAGEVIIEFVSPTQDPLTGDWSAPNILLTDGDYVWDGVLMNWIRDHSVRLPAEFLSHIAQGSGEPDFSAGGEDLVEAFRRAFVLDTPY